MLGKHVPRGRGPERQGAGSCLAPAGLTPWASGGLPGHGTVRVAAAGPSPSEGPLCPSREGLPPPHPSCDGAPPLAQAGDSFGAERALQPEEMKRACSPPSSVALPGL